MVSVRYASPVVVMSIVGGISVGSPPHGGADEDVLCHRFLHEALGGDHRDPARVDIGFVDDSLHTAEVVDVRVGVDHRDHRARAAVLLIERPRCSSGLLADQRIDDDHTGLAFDDAHHRQVEPA